MIATATAHITSKQHPPLPHCPSQSMGDPGHPLEPQATHEVPSAALQAAEVIVAVPKPQRGPVPLHILGWQISSRMP